MDAVHKLKELIDKNGRKYLNREPYKVFQELAATKEIDKQLAGGILMVLVEDCYKDGDAVNDRDEMSLKIQTKCCFNKKMSDRLADIFIMLCSEEHRAEWDKNELAGWNQFQKSRMKWNWKGTSVWTVSNGYITCHYEADIVIKPKKQIKPDKEITKLLQENTFWAKEVIEEHYRKSLFRHLDYEFEDYITCDDDYEPVAEDFEIEYHIKEWCNKNGFEMISCEGDGEDGGYEPNFRNGRWQTRF